MSSCTPAWGYTSCPSYSSVCFPVPHPISTASLLSALLKSSSAFLQSQIVTPLDILLLARYLKKSALLSPPLSCGKRRLPPVLPPSLPCTSFLATPALARAHISMWWSLRPEAKTLLIHLQAQRKRKHSGRDGETDRAGRRGPVGITERSRGLWKARRSRRPVGR